MNQNKKLSKFITELEKLSNKYKIGINVTGGIHILKGENKYSYICDYTSGDLLCKINENEIIEFSKKNEKSKRFQNFGLELSKISNKYNIAIQSIGGVNIFSKNNNLKIKYNKDITSGDINYNTININSNNCNLNIL